MSKGIDKKLDVAWSECVKIRDNYRCQYCGRTDTLNSHHLFTRSKRSTRWDISNGITLCVSHHLFNKDMSAHGAPIAFTRWLDETKGVEWVDKLRLKSNQVAKWSKSDKEEMLKDLREYIQTNSK